MNSNEKEKAYCPEDIPRLALARAAEGDAAGIADLYEPDAVLVIDDNGNTASGRVAIKIFYEQLLKSNPDFGSVSQRPVLKCGNLALTSSKLANGRITVEVARLQDDNSWLWVIDNPSFAMGKQ
ncbi:MAG: nuclear transport factor 2 family protein [Ginsengibacter sp.]